MNLLAGLAKIFNFYLTGFREMPGWGRKLWIIIILKLFIMFFLLKLFFFPDILKRDYRTDEKRSEYIIDQLIKQQDNDRQH
jgi:hypothetical protein